MASLFGRLRGGLALLSGRPRDAASLEESLRRTGLAFDDWLSASRRRLYSHLADGALERLRLEQQGQVQATLRAADAIVEHRFDLLGSGAFEPADPERGPGRDGYRPIDWYLDPMRGLRFPRGIRHTDWKLYAMRPGDADIKYPWELARCQHWPVLGQAWVLSADARYASEIANQLDDFMAANPVGVGVNWTCTMDVALRALNWAIALEQVRDCAALGAAFWQRAYSHLYDHGVFIFGNLENKYEVTSNHFLSNVVGLYYVAAAFREVEEGRAWDAFCRESLEGEMQVQVLDDGADYEASVPYHRLVTELFLGAARLADWRGEPLSAAYRAKLVKMVDFLAGVLRPDGLMPQIGDADDGRLHILSGYGAWKPQDARHLFAPAALALEQPRWLAHCGPDGEWEAAWWGFDVRGHAFRDGPPEDHAALFPHAGIAIARRGGTYLAATNGIVGTKGFGNHKHNDQLGFELHLDGAALVVDPGSFVYTSDAAARNLFRGTGYHSTVMVDGAEQNELRPEWLFRLFETAKAEHLSFSADGDAVEYRGRHVGYARLASPLIHERSFALDLGSRVLRIVDRFEGQGRHDLAWHFHLAPGVSAALERQGALLENAGRRYVLAVPDGLAGVLSEGWYSPSYGVRQTCRMLDWRAGVEIGGERRFEFELRPA